MQNEAIEQLNLYCFQWLGLIPLSLIFFLIPKFVPRILLAVSVNPSLSISADALKGHRGKEKGSKYKMVRLVAGYSGNGNLSRQWF